jgi:hypothetical protein
MALQFPIRYKNRLTTICESLLRLQILGEDIMADQFSNLLFDRDLIQIDEETLQERLSRIQPLILNEAGEACTFNVPTGEELRNIAYTWSPKNVKPIEGFKEKYRLIGTTMTHHGCAFYGFFKPSIAEVLAQVPKNKPDVAAFYIDSDTLVVAKEGDGHIVKTYWFKKR